MVDSGEYGKYFRLICSLVVAIADSSASDSPAHSPDTPLYVDTHVSDEGGFDFACHPGVSDCLGRAEEQLGHLLMEPAVEGVIAPVYP